MQKVEVGELGEQLAGLRLCDAGALEAVRRSLAQHGQLTALTLSKLDGRLEVIDGFKRVHAARALGMTTLRAQVEDLTWVEAKLHLSVLAQRSGLTELEEGWLVRSLYRDNHLNLPEIARLMGRHKSWVWRRLMLVEALDPAVQADVRLGLLAPRAAGAVSRLPRGNQPAASAVIRRLGLTVRQAELLVEEALSENDDSLRADLLSRRLAKCESGKASSARSTRAVRNEADWISSDVLKVRDISARLAARLSASPLETFTPAVSELLREALTQLAPVLHALGEVIARVAEPKDVA